MKTQIIAEIGSNHMGSMNLAKDMIDAAKKSGADIIKFQSWQTDKLEKKYPAYQESYQYYQKSELSDSQHHELIGYCVQKNIGFLTTCFDRDRIPFLSSLGMSVIKVASPDCGSLGMIQDLLETFQEVIVSTGMSTRQEIEDLFKALSRERITLMHCVSLYPTPLERVNLCRMTWLSQLGFPAGYSDHSMGTQAAKLAIAMGAKYIEKHFTIDRNLPGRDQSISCLPEDIQNIVQWRNQVYEMKRESHPELSDHQVKVRDQYVGKWGNNA